jgi:hypothetical protein
MEGIYKLLTRANLRKNGKSRGTKSDCAANKVGIDADPANVGSGMCKQCQC